ncbi:LLM class F420-dependent oxidoreductase, partial [Streptomyces violaceoruber]
MRQYDIGKDVPDVARAAERMGYESLWVFERALFPEPATQGLYGV